MFQDLQALEEHVSEKKMVILKIIQLHFNSKFKKQDVHYPGVRCLVRNTIFCILNLSQLSIFCQVISPRGRGQHMVLMYSHVECGMNTCIPVISRKVHCNMSLSKFLKWCSNLNISLYLLSKQICWILENSLILKTHFCWWHNLYFISIKKFCQWDIPCKIWRMTSEKAKCFQ